MSCACIVIASAKRVQLLDEQVVPSALDQSFDEVIVVGAYHTGEGYRYVPVPDMMANTSDALIKRDVGTMVSTSDFLFYLSDDHAIRQMDGVPSEIGHIGIPQRYCLVEGERLSLNMGLDPSDPNAPYAAGHAGLFHRELIRKFPWTAQPHDRLWDLLSSRILVKAGACLGTLTRWTIEDLTPETAPWR